MSGHTLTYRTVKLADCFGVDELPVQKTIYDRLKRVKRASTMEQDAVQPSSPTKKRGSLSRKGTGFPEPFCGDRNTTLPHPEADTSPNATIEAEDFDISRKHKHHFFHRKHQSSTFVDSIMMSRRETTFMEKMYGNITYADGSAHKDFATTSLVKADSAMDLGLDDERDSEKDDGRPKIVITGCSDVERPVKEDRMKGLLRMVSKKKA